ncbi:MAG: hypothetical protein V3V02_10220 [Rhizobiaceae bacterium]
MARKLEFKFSGDAFTCVINKVDRTKIYGRVNTVTYDANDKKCDLATLARDGRTIIPFGGTASGYVNTEGLWIDRDELVPIDRDGEKIPEVPSSFSAPTVLDEMVDVETFLDHPIRLAYHLISDEETTISSALMEKLKAGGIYQFPFSYRGGIYFDPAFLMLGEDDTLWMLIGHKSDIEYLGFEQAAICAARAEEETEDADEETDAFDFDML